jgi:hypothetical protein
MAFLNSGCTGEAQRLTVPFPHFPDGTRRQKDLSKVTQPAGSQEPGLEKPDLSLPGAPRWLGLKELSVDGPNP